MGEAMKATEVAERLRQLQAASGMTIQVMAERCGLPKRSLENYMNLKDPQHPGLDALLAVADGLGVSIDWLVGRSEEKDSSSFTKEDFALWCHSTVLGVLVRVLDAAKADPTGAVDPEKGQIMGQELHNIAALAMLDFLRIVDLQAHHPTRPVGYFKGRIENLTRMAQRETGVASIDALANRKP